MALTVTPEQEQAMTAQWESGTVTIRNVNGNTLRHRFSGRKIGKTVCGRWAVAEANVQPDSPNYDDCGACEWADSAAARTAAAHARSKGA